MRWVRTVRSVRCGAVALAAWGAMLHAAMPVGCDVGDARPLITKQFLHNPHHVMQSFAFDATNGELYAVQVEGADALGTWEQHSADGDLELTRLSADGATILGHMYLEGFGHGVSIGVEPIGTSTYVWAEVDSRPNAEGSGRGSKLGRFRFVDGQTLRHADPAIEKFSPMPEGVQVTPSINLAEGVLMERYVAGNQFRMALFRLADVKAGGRPVPLHDVPMPRGLGTFQGYCTEGDRVYLLTGDGYSAENPPPGNTELYCVDWRTGRVLSRARSDIFASQVHREPEGMAIKRDAQGDPLLCFGFASSVSAHDGRRVFSIAAVSLPAPSGLESADRGSTPVPPKNKAP